MDTSTNQPAATQASTDTAAAPIRLAFDSDAKKHFDNFEAHFFQQGDEASLAYDSYDEPVSRIKRWLPYRVLMGISIASTTVAVVACIALWRNNVSARASLAAADRPATPVATIVPIANAAVLPAAAAIDPAVQPVVAATNPAPAPAPTEPAVASPPAAVATDPVAPAAAPIPEHPVPALAQVEQAKGEPAKVEPAKAESPKIEEPKGEQAKAEAPTVPTEKTKAEAPVIAAAPSAEGEARARCRQSIHDKRAKDIVAVCSAAFDQDGTDAEAAVAVAKIEFDRGRLSQAYAWSKKAIAADPNTADAYVFAGGVEQSQGRGKAAKESYLHYLRLAPSGRYASELRTIVNSL